MALAVRRGELSKSKVDKEVLDIVNSDMTDKEIEDFAATSHKGLSKYVKESLCPGEYLVVIKPGFLGMAQKVIVTYEKAGFKLGRLTTTKLNINQAKSLYKSHKAESFYNDLCKYMSSGLTMALGLELGDHPQDDKTLKKLLGIKDKIREKYGESDMRNVLHSSDSWDAVKEESKHYF